MREKNYKISEVSKETGLSTDTLRYYEKAGLLKKVQRMAVRSLMILTRQKAVLRENKVINVNPLYRLYCQMCD